MAYNVATTLEKSVDAFGFLDLQPGNNIEAWLLGADQPVFSPN